mmetsp:Transcript_89347/g.163823  ORF Transcript_89347/g.163823 Transcript_89347/m.163823 type:complete len:205 (+) Transcript_89347:541-1155(+)
MEILEWNGQLLCVPHLLLEVTRLQHFIRKRLQDVCGCLGSRMGLPLHICAPLQADDRPLRWVKVIQILGLIRFDQSFCQIIAQLGVDTFLHLAEEEHHGRKMVSIGEHDVLWTSAFHVEGGLNTHIDRIAKHLFHLVIEMQVACVALVCVENFEERGDCCDNLHVVPIQILWRCFLLRSFQVASAEQNHDRDMKSEKDPKVTPS